MGDAAMVDTMLKDGLVDAFYGYHMGVTAENIAERWGLTRAVQDDYAARSQNRAEAARAAEQIYETRYRAGAVDLQSWLDSQETRRTAELNLLENRLEEIRAMITLYQALGGSATSATP